MFNNQLWQKPAAGGGDNFYTHQIANSVRMSDSGNSTLKFTAGTPTSGKTFTYSWWWKRYNIDSTSTQSSNVFCAGTGGATYVFWPFTNSSTPQFNGNFSGGNFGDNRLTTDMLFRDPASWYHCVLRFDSTQSSSSNRVRMYVNGVEPTYADASVQSAIAQDGTYSFMNASGVVQSWGGISGVGTGSEGVDVQFSEIVMCDGQSYAPTEFGETKNGVWIPKDPSGLTFGNNGYYLKFTNSSDLGEDFSGNNNDFTVANISSHDQMTDTPTNNFCNLNAVYRGDQTTAAKYGVLSKGNLQIEYSGSTDGQRPGTIKVPASGKWYFEYAITGGGGSSSYSPGAGIIDPATYTMNGGNYNDTGSIQYLNSNNEVRKDGSVTGTYGGTRGSNGDVMGIAADMDNGAFYVSKNGTWYAISGGSTGDPTSGASKTGAGATWTPASEYMNGMVPLAAPNGGSQPIQIFNFGQEGTFAGTETAGGNSDGNGYGNFFSSVPSGYLAICTQNLNVADGIDPAQTDDNFPMKLHNTWRYTGDGSERTIDTSALGNGFDVQFDLLLPRSDTYSQDPYWLNTSKGLFGTSSNNYYVKSNSTGIQAQLPQYNFKSQSGADYVLTNGTWFNSAATPVLNFGWRANGGTTSAGSGDLTSQHQVDPSGGFSIVTAVGDGSGSGSKTVSHGLSKAPTCIIAKNLDSTFNWDTYWSKGLTASTYGLRLNTGDAQLSGRWGTVNSSIFTCEYNFTWVGTDNFIYYCFTDIEGYIKTGVYVGNADTDGTFVYTGFKPAWLMVRYVESGESWVVSNNLRSPINPVERNIRMNSSNAESDSSTFTIDYLSNGFKVRTTWEGYNGNGYNIVYLAFAENPFKYATAR